jgi:hypothetical protein
MTSVTRGTHVAARADADPVPNRAETKALLAYERRSGREVSDSLEWWAPFHALAERFGGVVDGGETGWIDEAPGYYAR